ncbi:MAG: hypothetical protein ABI629_10160 [bacterium]
MTPTFPNIGPTITKMGVARADGQVTQPVATTSDGTPVYARPIGSGFFLYVEARQGQSNRLPGTSTFNSIPGNPDALPDFQIVVSRPLGNGSAKVCDNGSPPPPGGVPAVDPPTFGGTQASADAINDLACRFDYRGNSAEACTRNNSQDAAFVVANSRVQFCTAAGVGSEIAFPVGDTRVTVRLRDVQGAPGKPASIIIRVLP